MIARPVWFISAAGRSIGVDVPSGEPSHIHIPRPSRLPRYDAGARVEPKDELRDLAAADVVAPAA